MESSSTSVGCSLLDNVDWPVTQVPGDTGIMHIYGMQCPLSSVSRNHRRQFYADTKSGGS
jgi:hypothetical protein